MTKEQKLRSLVLQDIIRAECNTKEAAKKLGLSVRRTQELIKAYTQKGEACCVHGNTGRHPANYTPQDTRRAIIALAQSGAYRNCNVKQIQKKLQEEEGIAIPYNTLRGLLKDANIAPLRSYKVNTLYKNPAIAKAFHVHHAFVIKGSFFDGGGTSALHVMFDEVNDVVTGLCLCKQECLEGYLSILEQTCSEHRTPDDIYCNKYKNKCAAAFLDKAYVQGIGIFAVQLPAAKRKIRCLCRLLQKELSSYFALCNVGTYAAAAGKLRRFKTLFNYKIRRASALRSCA